MMFGYWTGFVSCFRGFPAYPAKKNRDSAQAGGSRLQRETGSKSNALRLVQDSICKFDFKRW